MGFRQQRQGERTRRSAKRKLTQQIEELQAQLSKQKSRAEKYKKRLYRAKKDKSSKSPRGKVNDLLRRQKVNSPVKRALLFHTTLIENVRRRYANAKTNMEKQLIAKVVSGNILKKYKLQKHALEAFGYSRRRAKYAVDLTYRGRRCISRSEITQSVTTFFLRDDVSRMTTGQKQTVTRLKKKMQKRLLTDTMKNLHRRFQSEHLGLATFHTPRFAGSDPFGWSLPLPLTVTLVFVKDMKICSSWPTLCRVEGYCPLGILRKCQKQLCATQNRRPVPMVIVVNVS